MNLKSLQALLAAIAACGIANAQEGGDGVGESPFDATPEAAVLAIAQPMSCEEARRTAWFERELARTDGGDVYLAREDAECREAIVAEANVDAID